MYIQYELIWDTIIIYKHKQIHINTYVYLIPIYRSIRASLVAQTVKSLPAMQKTRVQSLGWEDPLEKEMANHSSTLAWKIPWRTSLVGYSPWGRKESDMTEQLHSLHSHEWMWKLDNKEGWALKNWCFWIVMLEKTFEGPLGSKDIKPVNPRGN